MPFFTPNNPPDNQFVVRRILLPADITWTSVFDGMLLDLCYQHNWEKMGEMSVEDTADYFLQRYAEMTTDYKETPNSETPEDLDGTPQYPWYEQLYDWIIAGFLAITFTPNAAIVYQATVPKLRIAFRTGDIGALFRVLINGVEIWTGDSYAPIIDVLEQVFDTSSYETPYTVRIEHNGVGDHGYTSGKLEYIRNEVVADMVATILRADPNGCGVQWSTDNGGSWETIDLAECITGLSNDAIEQAIEDGTIARPGAQPGPEAQPEAGGCKTYHVELFAHSLWHSPFVVSTGDTILVTNWVGQWNDGYLNGLLAWECGDGGIVLLGDCTEPDVADPSDPLQTAAHMQIIGRNSVEYFDPLTLYTVPDGVQDENFILQANDDPLDDNSGEIGFDVTICRSTGLWCYEWDFRVNDGGWYGWVNDGHTYAYYASEVGWGEGDGNYNILRYDLGALREITSFEVWRSFDIDQGRNIPGLQDTIGHFVYRQTDPGSVDTDEGLTHNYVVVDPPANARYIELFGDKSGNSGASYVVKVKIRGKGTNPIGETNCT